MPCGVADPRRNVHNMMPELYFVPIGDERIEEALCKRLHLATAEEAMRDKKVGVARCVHHG